MSRRRVFIYKGVQDWVWSSRVSFCYHGILLCWMRVILLEVRELVNTGRLYYFHTHNTLNISGHRVGVL